MLIALAITSERLTRQPGAKIQRRPQSMSRNPSNQPAMLEEAGSHLTYGIRSCGEPSNWFANRVNVAVSATFSQIIRARRSAKGCAWPSWLRGYRSRASFM